jgi:hypothetical protein
MSGAELATGPRAAVVLGLAIVMAARAAPIAATKPSRHAAIDGELARDLAGWAARLSGHRAAPDDALPEFSPMADDELARVVCPAQRDGCRGIVAAYDTDRRRIVYRWSLDMRDPTDQSFIVHELVHWLQHRLRGQALIDRCEDVLRAEQAAYRVQNEYLTRFKQWQRMGDILRFTSCPADASAAGEPTVRMDASSGPIRAQRIAPLAPAPKN